MDFKKEMKSPDGCRAPTEGRPTDFSFSQWLLLNNKLTRLVCGWLSGFAFSMDYHKYLQEADQKTEPLGEKSKPCA